MIRADKTDLTVAVHSSKGQWFHPDYSTRLNLDRYTVTAFEPLKPNDTVTTLAVIADTVVHWLPPEALWTNDNPPSNVVVSMILDTFTEADSEGIPALLTKGFKSATEAIFDDPLASVTCVAAVIKNRRLYIASCGDCRVFLLREGHSHSISRVHSLAEILIERGMSTIEEIMNMIYDAKGPVRALGNYGDNPPADLRLRLNANESDEQALANQGMLLRSRDQIVLTSARVFGDYVEPDAQQQFEAVFLHSSLAPQEAVDQFIKLRRQENDVSDFTVILLRIP